MMMEPAGEPSLDMVTAALRADSSDIAIYAKVLTESLGESLPPDAVQIDRDRTMSDRMKGRPGQVTKITIRLGDQVLTLRLTGGAPVAEVCREVRGVAAAGAGRAVGSRAGEGPGHPRRAERGDSRGAAPTRGRRSAALSFEPGRPRHGRCRSHTGALVCRG